MKSKKSVPRKSAETPLTNQNATSHPLVSPLPSILATASKPTVDVSNDGENTLPLHATINGKSNQHESDGSTLMDIDEETTTPCLLSFKKKAQATVAAVISPSPWLMPDGAMEEENDIEDAKLAITNAKLNLKQLDQRILQLQLRAAKLQGAIPDSLATDLTTAKEQHILQQHTLKELEEAVNNLVSSSTPTAPNFYSDNDSEQSYSTANSYQDTVTYPFHCGLPMKLQAHWP